jgi:hypothetical protein
MTANYWIAMTTIAHPTVAVEEFSALARERGWGFAVTGDTKTPDDFACEGVDYLSVDRQHELYGEYSHATPVRHYARKNLAYLFAIANGAKVILESDDDNRPYPEFGTVTDMPVTGRVVGNAAWANTYRYFTDSTHIWPRGLPLDLIYETGEVTGTETVACPMQQFLADSDPDVDAIYRLLYRDPLYFDKSAENVILAPNCYCPFNSQNTIIHSEAFELLYLPAFVSFRMTDIWRSFIAQRILWEDGKSISFHAPTVYQERNAHNLMRDFSEEVVGYLNNARMAETLSGLDLSGLSIGDRLVRCYEALHEIGMMEAREIDLVRLWLDGVKAARQRALVAEA